MNPKPWLTTAEAAPLLGVSRASMWRMANGGAIPAAALMRSGRWVRIARTWIEGRHLVAAPATPAAITPGTMTAADAALLGMAGHA